MGDRVDTPTSITQFWMDRIIAERQAEAVAAYLSSPEFEERLARALVIVGAMPPEMTFWKYAKRIAKAYREDTDA